MAKNALSESKVHTFSFTTEMLSAVLDKIRLGLYSAHTFPGLYTFEKLTHKLCV